MSDSKASETKAAAKESAPPAVETSAGASSHNAEVQNLLAARNIYAMNGDKDAADAVTAQLKELGYE